MQSKLGWQERRNFYNSVEWKQMHDYILNRDHHECLWCKADGKVTTDADAVLEVDHIKELEFYPELRMDPNNLRTLCKDCHNKRHHRMNYSSHQHKVKPNRWREDERWD